MLQRPRAQFRLVAEIGKNEAEMKELVARLNMKAPVVSFPKYYPKNVRASEAA